MVDQIKKSAQDSMEKAIQSLNRELSRVRTGKAHTSALEPIRVDYYGSPTPLNQVAALSCPDARSYLIAPWEASILKEIETAIVKSDLGMSPINDGKVIRLKVPELTEERRKDIVKQVKKLTEDARIAVRMGRRDANEALKSAEKDKSISEDDHKRASDEIQKITDSYIEKVDKIGQDKEKDVMTV